MRDKKRRPGRYIGRIIDRKIQEAINNTRIPNPGLLAAIPNGPEGDSRRKRFVRAIQDISDAQRLENAGKSKEQESIMFIVHSVKPPTYILER